MNRFYDDAEHRLRILRQAEQAVRRLAYHHRLSRDVAEAAVHRLRWRLLRRLRAGAEIPLDLESAAAEALRRELSRREHRFNEMTHAPEPASDKPKPGHLGDLARPRLTHGEILARIAEGLSVLEADERRILELLDAGMTLREISLALGLREPAVRALARSGHAKIRAIFKRRPSAESA